MFTFKTATSEEYGIPEEAVRKLEELLLKKSVRMHGYMLLGGDKVLAERYWEPYGREVNHRMYSITKSFVALAIGLLEKSGRISLQDKICDYFPEKLPKEGVHPWCAEMTIEDMLTMRSCHSNTTYKDYQGEDWTESFFHVRPDHIPGTLFFYDTSAAHVLGALVEKLTGMKLLDYMRKEFLDELGFSKDAYIIEDKTGVSQGGSGMMSTLRDVAAVAYLCNHYGVLNGKELLPQKFIRAAISNQVPTYLQPKFDEKFGYGYYIWMPREEGYVFYGMGGQLAVCFPKFDFCYLTMADVIGNPAGLQILYDCFFETIYPYLKERREDNPLAFEEVETNKTEEELTTNTICTQTKGVTYKFYPNAMGWESLCFDWDKKVLHFNLLAGDFTLEFGENSWKKQSFLNTGFLCECQGSFIANHFVLEAYMVDEEQGSVKMEFAFKDSRLSMKIISTNDPFIRNTDLQISFMGVASAEQI